MIEGLTFPQKSSPSTKVIKQLYSLNILSACVSMSMSSISIYKYTKLIPTIIKQLIYWVYNPNIYTICSYTYHKHYIYVIWYTYN